MMNRAIVIVMFLCILCLAACLWFSYARNPRVSEQLDGGYQLERVEVSPTATRIRFMRHGEIRQLVTEGLAENGLLVALVTTPVLWGSVHTAESTEYLKRVHIDAETSVIDVGIGDSALVKWGDARYTLLEFERALSLAIDVSGKTAIIVAADLPAKEKVFLELARIVATISRDDTMVAFREVGQPSGGRTAE